MTIIEKIKSILEKDEELTLKDIYEKLSTHTPASIRGNLNRYILSGGKDIQRVKKGVYSLIQILDVQTNEDSKKTVSYTSTIFNTNGEVMHCFNKSYGVDSQTLENGIYDQLTASDDINYLLQRDEDIKSILYNGNSIEIMKKLESESFDLLITDPPYRVVSGGKNGKGSPKGMLSKNDGKIFDHNDVKFKDWIPEVFRIMKDGSHGYIFTNFLNLEELMSECREAGFEIHNLLVWEKNNATPNRWYMKNCEYIVFVRKGKAFPIKNCGSKTVEKFNNILGTKIHETEKPVDLLRMYIRNSSQGGWTIDPFAGSGSLLCAAMLENVKALGIELDQKYTAKSKERLIDVLLSI